jgi:hypothetical protein
MKKCVFCGLYELPGDDSLGIGAYVSVECLSLKRVAFDVCVFFFILREHCNTAG